MEVRKMTKNEALESIKKEVESVNRWMEIVEEEGANGANILVFMRVLESGIAVLKSTFKVMRGQICLGWDE